MTRPALRATIAAIGLLLCAGGALGEVRLYEATVPLAGPAEQDRVAALSAALGAAAVKASGRRDAGSNATIAGANPERYVQRYSKTDGQMLKVGFDGRAMEDLLQQAGLPVWPAERPLTVVVAKGEVDRAALERTAAWRGLPIAWGGSAAAPGGPGGGATLTGVQTAAGIAWTFVHAGRTEEAMGSAADGANLAADTLAEYYAPASTRSVSSASLRVGGIRDVSTYAALLAYLDSLSVVRSVAVDGLDGDNVRLTVTMRGDRELLARIAGIDGRLSSAPAATGPGGSQADYFFQP